MKNKIIKILEEIENIHNIKILYAVESGSRAWGFESNDSDYDIRFIYINTVDKYLSLYPVADVIEVQPEKILDFAGWDIKKTLLLFYKSNPPLLEWLKSPYVYLEKFSLVNRLREYSEAYFSPKSCMYHYLHTAEGQYKRYFQGDLVKIKKYFYTLRPLFACEWIEKKNTMPPMEFRRLFEVIDNKSLLDEVESLVRRKKSSNETDIEPKINILCDYITAKIEYYKLLIKEVPTSKPPDEKLNKLFIDTLTEVWCVNFENR